jgi:hypothetical protein
MIMSDPCSIRRYLPPDILPIVIDKVVIAIRNTFTFGMCTAFLAAFFFNLVPWDPLLTNIKEERSSPEPQRDVELLPVPQEPPGTKDVKIDMKEYLK